MVGKKSADYMGSALEMSGDGNTISSGFGIVSVPGLFDAGTIRILDGEREWKPMGDSIHGT